MKLILISFIVFVSSCKKQDSTTTSRLVDTSTVVTALSSPKSPPGTYSYLALGDSYTVGYGVFPEQSYPMQLVDTLGKSGLKSNFTKVIAGSGWTTGDLITNINREHLTRTFDVVTLLIGVNNQYRNFNENLYRTEFSALLETAIRLAGGDKTKVFVLTIPDWGVTPYARTFGNGNTGTITQQINQYNTINKQESEKRFVTYIDVTPISRLAANDLSLLASDNLHPSGKMYSMWVKLLAPNVITQVK